uniref:Uncharacterized protein n=1 Tax=Schizaphis graminum TaxID=13262 RepID=A0A2S2PEB0_SCHGA
MIMSTYYGFSRCCLKNNRSPVEFFGFLFSPSLLLLEKILKTVKKCTALAGRARYIGVCCDDSPIYNNIIVNRFSAALSRPPRARYLCRDKWLKIYVNNNK